MSITEQALLARGYRKFEAASVTMPYADYFYQKRIVDEAGTKYFIEVVHYPLKAEHRLPESWQCGMTVSGTGYHYEFKQHWATDIERCEQRCEVFFQTMGCEYYERDPQEPHAAL